MNEYLWPLSRLGEALEALAIESGLASANQHVENPEGNDDPEAVAPHLGLEAQQVETPYPDFEHQLAQMGPAMLRIGTGFLAIVRRGEPVHVLAPDGSRRRVKASAIRSAVCRDIEAPAIEEIDRLLNRCLVRITKQDQAREAILRERLSTTLVRGIWLLRLRPGASFQQQLRQARVPQRLLGLTVAHAIQYILWILAWWVIGANVLHGSADRTWLVPWALLLLTLAPIRALITWLQGQIAIGAGARLKQRLFAGALRLAPDSIRHQGAGQLLGRVIETEAVEALALSGGFLALVAIIELLISVFVLGAGAGGMLQSALLGAWVAVAALIAVKYYRANQAWTDVRLRMTHDLVESMVGHRTRLVQLPPEAWHAGEDAALQRYLDASRAMDNSTATLLAIVPRGWLVAGLAGLIPAFAYGSPSTTQVAISVGGMLLAYRALKRVAAGAWQLAGAVVAWQRVAVLFHAAARPDVLGSLVTPARAKSSKLVEARELVFRYVERAEPVLRGCNLQISAGDRLLIEGASGGGKSTLVSLLAGLREADSGRLLMNGSDRQTLGSEVWRKYVAAAPQFHENHVLAETFAFNLFMSRRGTIGPRELDEAEAICYELGLGELLDRMPAGLLQMVGETGWQLSHGERSRLYIARALLQNAELIVLDESFAALDPENLQRVVECVLKRARSLMVIAHR